MKTIVKHLEKIEASGKRSHDVFRDWLALVEASLRMLPKHLRSIRSENALAEDEPEVAETIARIRGSYPEWCGEHFSHAFAELLNLASWPITDDVLGRIYMDYAYPNPNTGQFFTPFPVCLAMAQMNDVESLVVARLRLAWRQAGLADILRPTDVMLGSEYFVNMFSKQLLRNFEPVTVHDPTCGSGSMLLAVAAVCPPWMSQVGLIQYYGQDNDQICVLMARTNMMLYGLNGYLGACLADLENQVHAERKDFAVDFSGYRFEQASLFEALEA